MRKNIELEREMRQKSLELSGPRRRSTSLIGYGSPYRPPLGTGSGGSVVGGLRKSPRAYDTSSSYTSVAPPLTPRSRRYSTSTMPSMQPVPKAPSYAASYVAPTPTRSTPEPAFHLSSNPLGPQGSRIISKLGRITATSHARAYQGPQGDIVRENIEVQRDRLMNKLIANAKSRGGNGIIGVKLGSGNDRTLWAEGDVVVLKSW